MKYDIIRMAQEAELYEDGQFFVCKHDELERFAALVIKPWADQLEVERKKFQELNDVAALGMQHARAAEREACAKVCDVIAQKMDDEGEGPNGNIRWVIDCAESIRARGNT